MIRPVRAVHEAHHRAAQAVSFSLDPLSLHALQQVGGDGPTGAMTLMCEMPLDPLLERGALRHTVLLMPFLAAFRHRAGRSDPLAPTDTASVTKPTTVTELSGIRIAAIKGVS